MSWTVVILALGLALLIEGLLYALVPDRMRRLITMMLEQPPDAMRYGGLLLAVLGGGLCLLALRL